MGLVELQRGPHICIQSLDKKSGETHEEIVAFAFRSVPFGGPRCSLRQ